MSSKNELSDSKETIQETLNRLEKVLIAKSKAVDDLKEKLYVAQEERFRSYQELTSVKERYLISVVESLQSKVNERQNNLQE